MSLKDPEQSMIGRVRVGVRGRGRVKGRVLHLRHQRKQWLFN